MGALQVVAGRGGQSQLVTHEIVEHRPRVTADGTMGLIGDHQGEIRRGKQLPVLVVEEQGLHGTDHDPGASPVFAFLLVDDGVEVGGEQFRKNFASLLFQFQPVHQEKHAMGVAGTEKELDDSRRGERFAGSGGHLEKKTVIPFPNRLLQGMDGFQLIRT